MITFIGRKFPTDWDYGLFEEKTIESIINQIERKFPLGNNIIINTTWFFTNDDNENWIKCKNFVESNNSGNVFLLAFVDPAPNPRDLEKILQLFCKFNVYKIGNFSGKYAWDFAVTILCDRFKKYSEDEIILTNIKYNFLSYSRKPHEHRLALYKKYVENNLLDSGIATLGKGSNHNFDATLDENLNNYVQHGHWYGNAPDGGYSIPHDLFSLGRLDIWQHHFLNIANETLPHNTDQELMVTEKTFKPLIGMRPFLINGDTRSYQWLRDRGFKTFNHLFPNNGDIIETLLWLKDQSKEQIQQLYNNMLPDLRHNRSRFFEFAQEEKLRMEDIFNWKIFSMLDDCYIGFIRLESFHRDNNFFIDEINKLLKENIREAKNKNAELFMVFSFAWEAQYPSYSWYDNVVLLFEPLLKENNITNYKFVFNNTLENWNKEYGDKTNSIFFDFNALRVYHRSFKIPQTVNAAYNINSDHALWLVGKLYDRKNRLPLLAKFYEKNLLKYLNWSLYFNDTIKQECQVLVPQFNNEEYEKFMSTVDRKLDNVEYILRGVDNIYHGFPYDSNLFTNACLSVVAETHFLNGDIVWITEKTFKAIANKHPFIMSSVQQSLAYLRSIGFKTFEEYMLVEDYDTIIDQQARLDAVVKNTKYFIENKHKYATEINADVEHNFKRFCEYCDAERKKLTNVLPVQDEELTWFLIGQM